MYSDRRFRRGLNVINGNNIATGGVLVAHKTSGWPSQMGSTRGVGMVSNYSMYRFIWKTRWFPKTQKNFIMRAPLELPLCVYSIVRPSFTQFPVWGPMLTSYSFRRHGEKPIAAKQRRQVRPGWSSQMTEPCLQRKKQKPCIYWNMGGFKY